MSLTPATHNFSQPLSRRRFLKAGVGLSALPLLGSWTPAYAGGSDRLRIGLVGCGGRGIGAVRNCLAADPAVQLWAVGDIFPDRVEAALVNFREGQGGNNPQPPVPADRMTLPSDRCFSGFDAYKGVIASGIDIILLVTPPQFRPLHLEAALAANLHVFAEKPVAVDPVGARKIIALGEVAAQKNLAMVAGTQRRHANNYLETMARVRDGAIGELTGGQCYWIQGGLWHRGREAEWSEMEYQIRNWLYFTWLSGDHIVEQHVHNIDVMNWAFGGPPIKALGMGGRQARTDPKYGDAWDHFSVEFEYAGGVRVQSLCRQTPGGSRRVGENLVGTRGTSDPAGTIRGERPWKFADEPIDGQIQEHVDMIKSIREGRPLNHARRIAESTLTAILGRMSAYSGRELSFNWLMNASKLDLTPQAYVFGDAPEVTVPVPGQTPLV